MKCAQFNILVLIALTAVVIFAFKTKSVESSQHSLSLPTDLHTGDVILRDSKGMISSFFRNFSQTDKKYSHAGFVNVVEGKFLVCHYIDQDERKGLKIEEIKDFVSLMKCNAFAVYRYAISRDEENTLSQVINYSIMHPLPFDNNFDLKSDGELYCTEWISKSLWKAAHLKINVTAIGGMNYVAPDNLYINSVCKLIFRCNYQKNDRRATAEIKKEAPVN